MGLFGNNSKAKDGAPGLSGPKDIPEVVGRYMVVEMKENPNRVWTLRGVTREIGKKEYYCRVYEDGMVAKAGINVKDWTSLDGHPELVLFEGYFNKDTNVVRPEKYKG